MIRTLHGKKQKDSMAVLQDAVKIIDPRRE